MKITKPDYYDRFRCAAGRCPDSCCKEWEVQVDAASAARYRALPGALGDRLREVLRDEDGETYMTVTDGRCPMWDRDGLCRLQRILGEAALCDTCREFPRLRHDYGDFLELGLELSCPEAAKYILSPEPERTVTEERPGGQGEYDREAMALLLSSREEALALLDRDGPVPERLALLMMYGCQVQSLLDGGEPPVFSPEAALETARSLAVPGDAEALLAFFHSLERLTPDWERMLLSPREAPWEEGHIALARYLVRRYWLQAVSDYDLYSRVKFAAVSCLAVKHLGGTLLRTAQLYSKEIENDADNVDALLDGAYTAPALRDEALFGLLL